MLCWCIVAAGLAVGEQATQVCVVVGDVEKHERECGAGPARQRLAAPDTVHQAVQIPRSRKTPLNVQLTCGRPHVFVHQWIVLSIGTVANWQISQTWHFKGSWL